MRLKEALLAGGLLLGGCEKACDEKPLRIYTDDACTSVKLAVREGKWFLNPQQPMPIATDTEVKCEVAREKLTHALYFATQCRKAPFIGQCEINETDGLIQSLRDSIKAVCDGPRPLSEDL